jgi:hypothetical protein
MNGKAQEAMDSVPKMVTFSTEPAEKAVSFYLKCIIEKLLGLETTESETQLDLILKEDFILRWRTERMEDWAKTEDLATDTRTFILAKTEMLKKKQG